MAKRWSAVTRSLWSDARFLELSAPEPNAQTLWIYLLTGPHQGPIPGLFPVGIGAIADALNWSPDEVRTALGEVEEAGMIATSQRPPLIFLPKAITHNQPANPNIIKGWKSHWDEIPECPLRDRALFTLRRSIKDSLQPTFDRIFREELARAHGRPVDPSPPVPVNGSANRMRNPDPDQDHERTIVRRKKRGAPAPSLAAKKSANEEDALKLALYLREAIETHSGDYAAKLDDRQIQSWSMILERLIRLDNAKPDEVRAVIQWAHVDDPKGFWQSNLLSASSLRKQYPRLLLQAKKAGSVQRVVDEKVWKEEHGTWAIRVGQRTVITGGSFDGPTLIAAARLEGVPIPEVTAANRIAEWAATCG